MNENLILRKANKSYHYGYYKGIYFELANIAFTNKWFWLCNNVQSDNYGNKQLAINKLKKHIDNESK